MTVGVRRTETVYVSDRNQEFVVSEMSYSHLLNAHAHHTKQLETLEAIFERNRMGTPCQIARDMRDNLQTTIDVLEQEILTRKPSPPEDYPDPRDFPWGYHIRHER